jgi:hypothetical protein
MEAAPAYDCDVTAEVGAHHTRTRPGQSVDHVLAGMTVPVMRPDADDCNPRAYGGKELFRTVSRTMMRHFEHISA